MDYEKIPRAYMSPSETRFYNRKTVELMSVFLNIAPDFIDIGSVDEISKSCGVTREYAYAEMLAALCGIDSGGADRAYFKNYFLPMIHEQNASDFLSDPYRKNIKIPSAEYGKWTLGTKKLKAGEAFVCRDFLVTDDGRLIPQLGFFAEDFEYPAVSEDGREWMTLMPNETVTSSPAIEAAHGRVLTYGLGLGYFAYMAAEKEAVRSVTVIEQSTEAISLFRDFILPQFPHGGKVEVINADALAFAASGGAADYDFVFADIWHDAADGRDLYLKFKDFEPLAPKADYAYWLEDTIKCYLDKSLWE